MSGQLDIFGEAATAESSAEPLTDGAAGVASEPATLCRWCAISPAVATVHGWPTCATCNTGRWARVHGYLGRLERAARGRS